MPKTKPDLRQVILDLLKEHGRVNLKAIAKAAGLSADSSAVRRAIQRALTDLSKQSYLYPQGEARARTYLVQDNVIRYKPDFLNAYTPNQDYYLSPDDRKELHDEGRVDLVTRPAGTFARSILNRLLVDLSWNSSRLEGNTYSLLETKRLIELGESAEGKSIIETQMILNHKNAIEYIITSIDEKIISAHEIRSIHALLSENLLGDPSASGKIRNIPIGIHGSIYQPLDNQFAITECFDAFVNKLNLIHDPFEQSIFALAHLSYLQAFEDVNKRTARLVANIPLIKHNLRPLSFVDVAEKDYIDALISIYEENDIRPLCGWYMRAYKQSSKRYSATQKSLDGASRLKIKYRDEIKTIIRSLIIQTIPGAKAVTFIHDAIHSSTIIASDCNKLVEIIENEVISLHEGNIAIFKITPEEFKKWQEVQ